MTAPRQYIKIVDWERHVMAELRRKCKLPWRWCALLSADLDRFDYLTLAEQGGYTRLLMLATLSDNHVPYRPAWLRRRAGLTKNIINRLVSHSLVEIVDAQAQDEKAKQNQSDAGEFSGQLSDSLRKQSGNGPDYRTGEDRTEQNTTRQSSGEEAEDQEPTSARSQGHEKPDPLSPSHSNVDALIADIANQKRTGNSKRRSKGHDERSWDQILAIVLELALKLKTVDAEKIFKCGGPSRRLSPNQISVALTQLADRGKLKRVSS